MSFDNELGKITLYKGVFSTERMFETVRDTLKWKRNSIHGNHDRMTWDGTKAKNKHKKLFKEIGDKIKSIFPNYKKELGKYNFANHYKGKDNRTFWHHDSDINPGEEIVMVTFGSPRTLTFVDYRTDKAYDFVLGDGDVVIFDFNWNMNTFHAIEKTNRNTGECISVQFFSLRDESQWTAEQKRAWKESEPIKKQAVARRRNYVKKLFARRKRKRE